MSQTYSYQVGETIRIPLLTDESNIPLVENIRANLKLTKGNKQIPDLSVAPNAVFDIEAANGGWILEVPAVESVKLKPGLYAVNVAMEISGVTVITDPSYVKVEPSTTT